MITLILGFKIIATILSMLGAILNGYGAGKHHYHILLYGQITWIISNLMWIIYAIFIIPDIQVLVWITFFGAAIYGTFNMLMNVPKKV